MIGRRRLDAVAVLYILAIGTVGRTGSKFLTGTNQAGTNEDFNGTHYNNGSVFTEYYKINATEGPEIPVEFQTFEAASDIVTRLLQRGIILVYFVGALYSFAAIGIICGDYFLPSVDCICSSLNLSQDVAAATFMSFATTSPELFVILIATFLTQSDIGLGAVVGSGMFNILGVATVGGLAATTSIKLDWWPLFRDSLVYIIAVGTLAVILSDGKVTLIECLCLIFFYFIYFIIMFCNRRIRKNIKRLVKMIRGRRKTGNDLEESKGASVPTISHVVDDDKSKNPASDSSSGTAAKGNEQEDVKSEDDAESPFKAYFVNYEEAISLRRISASSRGSNFSDRRKSVKSLKDRMMSPAFLFQRNTHPLQSGDCMEVTFSVPVSKCSAVEPTITECEYNGKDKSEVIEEEKEDDQTFRSIFLTFPAGSLWAKFSWLALWPMSFLFFWTIPDCRMEKSKKYYLITFLMCIFWIGVCSYAGTWLISEMGVIFGVPDSVMGLTFLAFGGSMPEAISTYIMARQGEGGLGFSNSLGGNTMDICLCLGIPWLVKCIMEGSVQIYSDGLVYNTLALISGVFVLISVGIHTKFKMNRTMGVICCVCYLIFVVTSILVELEIIPLTGSGN